MLGSPREELTFVLASERASGLISHDVISQSLRIAKRRAGRLRDERTEGGEEERDGKQKVAFFDIPDGEASTNSRYLAKRRKTERFHPAVRCCSSSSLFLFRSRLLFLSLSMRRNAAIEATQLFPAIFSPGFRCLLILVIDLGDTKRCLRLAINRQERV